jgi:hypothetical protein
LPSNRTSAEFSFSVRDQFCGKSFSAEFSWMISKKIPLKYKFSAEEKEEN